MLTFYLLGPEIDRVPWLFLREKCVLVSSIGNTTLKINELVKYSV